MQLPEPDHLMDTKKFIDSFEILANIFLFKIKNLDEERDFPLSE
jgi:hypothetical protein